MRSVIAFALAVCAVLVFVSLAHAEQTTASDTVYITISPPDTINPVGASALLAMDTTHIYGESDPEAVAMAQREIKRLMAQAQQSKTERYLRYIMHQVQVQKTIIRLSMAQ